MENARQHLRKLKGCNYTLTWRGPDGERKSMEGRGVDVSAAGVGIVCGRALEPDTMVHVQGADGAVVGDCFVAHCTRDGVKFHIGFEFSDSGPEQSAKTTLPPPPVPKVETAAEMDYYEVLQISPKADLETIHRVFRIMAVRFHPDNPESGNVEEFLRLKQAYNTLSDPSRRAEYDAHREAQEAEPMPIFELKDFVTGVEAESNRRLGVLSLLYNQRRSDPDHPGVSLLDLEKRMGFPREYLSFTMWYLRSKEYVHAADNSDYALSAAGVDFIEKNAPGSEILTRLLQPGTARYAPVGPYPKRPKKDAPKTPGMKFLMDSSVKG
jgi:curved DNA-binding protein CbpA